jgi:hypothetical protein
MGIDRSQLLTRTARATQLSFEQGGLRAGNRATANIPLNRETCDGESDGSEVRSPGGGH